MSSQPSDNNIDQALDDLLFSIETKAKQNNNPPPQQSVTSQQAENASVSQSNVNYLEDAIASFNVTTQPQDQSPSSQQPSRLAVAKQGDPDAITDVLNYLLKGKGIVTKVTLQREYLFVILQGETTPDQEESISYIRNFVKQLELPLVTKAKITAKRKGATFSAWKQEINLTESPSNQESWFNSITQSAAGLGGNITNSVSQASQGVLAKVKGNGQSSETTSFQDKLTEKMMGLFDLVIEERQQYYASNPDKVPDAYDVLSIVENYASKNSKIAIAANIIPGPWGLVAAIPEITLIIRNQLAMIYDIGMAYGKGDILGRELLAGSFAYALGARGVGLITVQGGKIVVKRVTIKVFQSLIPFVGRRIGQTVFKSLVGKFLPIVGAVGMSVWAKYSTREIAKKTTATMKQKVEYSDEILDDLPLSLEDLDVKSETTGIDDILKVKLLINLIKIDGKIEAKEREYVQNFIKNADIKKEDKKNLLMSIYNNSQLKIDYSQLAQCPDDAVGLLIDLIALSKRDGELNFSKKMYITQVGKAMGFFESDIDEMMATG